MAIDFSSIGAEPAHTGKIDFSGIGGIPAVGGNETPADETSALGAASRGAVGMIPLGTQALAATAGALQNEPYLQERQEIEKEIQSDIASHPISRLTGEAAGLVAPTVLTGGATAPESLAGAIGQGAGIGAGFGAGSAIDTLASGGDRVTAAKDLALSTALGAAGGGVGQKISEALQSLSPALQKYAANKATQAANLGVKELGNMTPEELQSTGQMLLDKGIVRQGATQQEMFDSAHNLEKQYGETIGNIGNQAEELGLKTDPTPLINNLSLLEQDAKQFANPDERKAALWYRKGAADLQAMANKNIQGVPTEELAESGGPYVTFDQLQRLKQAYGNSAFENGAVKNSAAANIYGELKDGLQSIVKSAQTEPNLPNDLKEALNGYSTMYPITNGLQDALAKERAGVLTTGRGFGMVGRIVGQIPGQQNPAINALTSLGLLATGHPFWGLGTATSTLQNPQTMSGLASKAADIIPGIASAIPTAGAQAAAKGPTSLDIDHPALGPWKQIFQKNASTAQDPGGVQKANAVTDFVLSQRDPEYAAAKQKVMDDEHKNPEPTPPSTAMAKGGVVVKPKEQFNGLRDKLKTFLQKEGKNV